MYIQGLTWKVTNMKKFLSKILGALITLCDPLFKLLRIARSESDLKGLRLSGQCSSNGIALNCIENRSVGNFLCCVHVESSDQTDECREKLSVCKVGAGTHARARSVAVVRSARALIELQVSLRDKFISILEVILIVISSPGILKKVSKNPNGKEER